MFLQNILSAANLQTMKPALIVLAAISAVLLIASVIATVLVIQSKRLNTATRRTIPILMFLTTALVVLCTVFCFGRYETARQAMLANTEPAPVTDPTDDEVTEPSTTQPTEPPTEPQPTLAVTHVEDTDPDKYLKSWDIQVDGEIVDAYDRTEPISFDTGDTYTDIEGVITFRGNNYRTGGSYGTVNITANTLTKMWSGRVGSLNRWSGIGWTGQPLIVKWDEETKQHMNLKAEKKAKKDLVEVIATTLDGNIYFYDLEDGSYTRDPLFLEMNFKGTASLDPRGYPMMFIGSGDNYKKTARMFGISLIDCSVILERSGKDGFNHRLWYAFDSSPMISAATDTLIWPGENGVFYTIKLNTQYDAAAGTLSINPGETVKTRYKTNIGRSTGCEASAIIVENYMYVADNGALFFCIDLNTMKPVWIQNVGDDTNATPVFEWGDDGVGYIYTGTSMEYGKGSSHLYKLNANTGEIVWKVSYSGIPYDKGVSGGVLSSVAIGKKGSDMEGLVIFSIGKTGGWKGTLVALNTETGEKVWEKTLSNYCWSSPVIIYNDNDKGYLLQCDSTGKVFLMDGKTGEKLTEIGLGSNIEASPAVYNDMMVVGTRGGLCCGVKIG